MIIISIVRYKKVRHGRLDPPSLGKSILPVGDMENSTFLFSFDRFVELHQGLYMRLASYKAYNQMAH